MYNSLHITHIHTFSSWECDQTAAADSGLLSYTVCIVVRASGDVASTQHAVLVNPTCLICYTDLTREQTSGLLPGQQAEVDIRRSGGRSPPPGSSRDS